MDCAHWQPCTYVYLTDQVTSYSTADTPVVVSDSSANFPPVRRERCELAQSLDIPLYAVHKGKGQTEIWKRQGKEPAYFCQLSDLNAHYKDLNDPYHTIFISQVTEKEQNDKTPFKVFYYKAGSLNLGTTDKGLDNPLMLGLPSAMKDVKQHCYGLEMRCPQKLQYKKAGR